MRRRDGWWGIASLILLLLQASIVSVPTAKDPAEHVKAFYAAHGTVIVIAQAILFVALAMFTVAVARGQVPWLVGVGLASAGLMLVHAAVSLFGVSALEAVAPFSFVVFLLLLSIRMLVQPIPEPKAAPTA